MCRFCQELLTFVFGVVTLITLTSLARSTSLYATTPDCVLYLPHIVSFLSWTYKTSNLAGVRLKAKMNSTVSYLLKHEIYSICECRRLLKILDCGNCSHNDV